MDVVARLLGSLRDWIVATLSENLYLVGLLVYTIVRATGVTVQSGTTGLLFSFGRARAIVEPGFRMLIPFLQVVRTVPTRQRAMNLPAQRVTTLDGLVYLVDANLVYRIVDVRKALIEIDDLLKGMRQVLVLSVREVLRLSRREDVRDLGELDRRLSAAMAPRLAPWGVEVERAGFTSITPSKETLRLTQLAERVSARRANLALLERGAPRPLALALLGTSQRVLRRARVGREREIARRRRLRVERLFRRIPLGDLDRRARERLLRELLADAGLSGVLGDAGFVPRKPSARGSQVAATAVKRPNSARELGRARGRPPRRSVSASARSAVARPSSARA